MVEQLDRLDRAILDSLFGSQATEEEPDEAFWAYEISDERGVTLRLSANEIEGSIQTAILVGGVVIDTTSCEQAVRVTVDLTHREFVAEFDHAGAWTTLRLRVAPEIACSWATLRADR